MATIKISELEEVTELSSGDVLPIVNNNETKKVSIEKLNEILGGNTDDTSAARALKIEYYRDGATFDTEENRETISEYYTALRRGEAPELFIAFNEFDGSVSGDNSYMYRASVISIDDYNLSLYCPTQVNTSSSQNRYGVNYNERYELEINVGIDSSNDNYNATYINHYYTKGWSLNGNSSILGMNNTTAFTPTGDYNPATKKYVDEAVANSSGGGSGSVDLTNVLTKDNTEEFTPDGDYEPATKKYVDDGDKGIIVLNKLLISSTVGSGFSIEDETTLNSILNGMLKNLDNPPVILYTSGLSVDTLLFTIDSISTYNAYKYFSYYAIRFLNERANVYELHTLTFRIYGIGNTPSDTITISNVRTSHVSKIKCLKTDNTDSYTPTSDYNPATKKYVDDAVTDAIASAITTVLEAEY